VATLPDKIGLTGKIAPWLNLIIFQNSISRKGGAKRV
jgi:hypothetical protein